MPVTDQPMMDFTQLKQALEAANSTPALYTAVVEEPLANKVGAAHLFLGFIVLFLVPKSGRHIKLIAVSDTEHYERAVNGYNFKESEFQLSLADDANNDIVKAVLNGKPRETTDWRTVRRSWADPVKTNLNQANSGISSSFIYPLDVPRGGALMFCFYQYQQTIGPEQRKFMRKYTKLAGEYLRLAS